MITKGGGVDALTSGGHPRCPTQLIAPGLRSDDWSVTRCLGSLPAQSPRPRSSAPLLSLLLSNHRLCLLPSIYLLLPESQSLLHDPTFAASLPALNCLSRISLVLPLHHSSVSLTSILLPGLQRVILLPLNSHVYRHCRCCQTRFVIFFCPFFAPGNRKHALLLLVGLLISQGEHDNSATQPSLLSSPYHLSPQNWSVASLIFDFDKKQYF